MREKSKLNLVIIIVVFGLSLFSLIYSLSVANKFQNNNSLTGKIITGKIMDSDEAFPDYITEIEDATNVSFTGRDLAEDSKVIQEQAELNQTKKILLTLLIIFAAFAIVLLIVGLAKSNPILMVALIAIIIIVTTLFVDMFFNTDNPISDFLMDDSDWNNKSIDSFGFNELADMTLVENKDVTEVVDQYLNIDNKDYMLNSKYYTWQNDDSERHAIVIEFVDRLSLSNFMNEKLDVLNEKNTGSETIYEINQNLLKDSYSDAMYFDENRFLFLIFGDVNSNDPFIQKAVYSYPKNSVMSDVSLPKIVSVIPQENGYTNSDRIIFDVTDSSGIDKKTISVENIKDVISCDKIDDGYRCSFNMFVDKPGKYSYRVFAKDRKGNINQRNIYFNLDNVLPVASFDSDDTGRIEYISDEIIESYFSDDYLINLDDSTFSVLDKLYSAKDYCSYSGVDDELKKSISCSINPYKIFSQGSNRLKFQIHDYAGNKLSYQKDFLFDSVLPTINFTNPSYLDKYKSDNVIEFFVSDKISGINTASFTLSGVNGFGNFIDYCRLVEKNVYMCKFLSSLKTGINTLSVHFSDNAGNVVSESLDFIYDDIKPFILWNSKNITNQNDYILEFDINDQYSEISTDYFLFNGEDRIDLLKYCLASVNSISCKIPSTLKLGSNIFSIEFMDKADNIANSQKEVFYDSVAPEIRKFEFIDLDGDNMIFIQLYDDYQINVARIIESSNLLKSDENCVIDSDVVSCYYDVGDYSGEITLSVYDMAGNNAKKTLVISV